MRHIKGHTRIVFGILRNLGKADITRSRYKARELRVGDRRFVNPEITDLSQSNRLLIVIKINTAHMECGALDKLHPAALGWLESGLLKFNSCHSRSEEHTSELQSLMRISYAVFC